MIAYHLNPTHRFAVLASLISCTLLAACGGTEGDASTFREVTRSLQRDLTSPREVTAPTATSRVAVPPPPTVESVSNLASAPLGLDALLVPGAPADPTPLREVTAPTSTSRIDVPPVLAVNSVPNLVTAPVGAGVSPTPGSPTARPSPDGTLFWSSVSTWGGTLPTAGAEVVIPAGRVIVLDIDTPNLAGLRIEGTLQFARKDVQLTAGFIDVTGALEIGSAALPFAQRATITLTGAPKEATDAFSRGLNVRGGRLDLHGVVPRPVWTKLSDHAVAGATTLTLKERTTGWRAGDTVAVAPTDYYGVASTERLQLANAHGGELTLATPLAKFRWGKMQYVTNQGMSLAPEPGFVPPTPNTATEIDQRAAVANLSRNIVIQGSDDTAWRSNGFGAHVMVMGLASKVVIDGVEVRRAGQAGRLARYPIHWHMLSYDASGNLIGDAVGHVIRNSSIWNSAQRCVVIHATNGVQVLNNICQDIKGHAFFLEDAVERRNVFEGNLALMTRMPATAQRLQVHEGQPFQGGPSGFWITNPDNRIRNNHSGDTQGNGFWLAFPSRAIGASKAVVVSPNRLPMGAFEGNTAHTANAPGVMLAFPPIDDEGNTTDASVRFIPTDSAGKAIPVTFADISVFKSGNGGGAYRNVGRGVSYSRWASADNVGTHMSGSSDTGAISDGLFIGYSLNNLTAYPITWDRVKPAAFATYNSGIDMRDNIVVNFPIVPGETSGAWRTDDYYLAGINKGTFRNPNNRLIGSNPGYRTPPPNMDSQPLDNRNWTLSGALWDPNGYAGVKGQFWVYDVPFLTQGGPCQPVAPAGQNGMSCSGQYYGIEQFTASFDMRRYDFRAPIRVDRIDDSGASIGIWSVGDGELAPKLANMRHFAARQSGKYILRFPGKPAPNYVAMTVTNVFRSSDSFVLAIQFDGATDATGYTVGSGAREEPSKNPPWWTSTGSVRWFQPAGNLAEVNTSSGDRIWQDRANNLVWIKVVGGLTYFNASALFSGSDDDLYRPYGVVLYKK